MKAIAKGDKGPEVEKWQFFLHGHGYPEIIADGDFGSNTQKASMDFQSKNGLTADGIIGNATYLKAMQYGFQLVEDHPDNADEFSSAWPGSPGFNPLGLSDLQSIFGRMEYTINPDHTIIITNHWAEENLVTVPIPQIKALPPYFTGKITVHKKVAGQFQALFNEWEKAGLTGHLLTYDGAYQPRLIRGSNTNLSNHAFGVAIDLNAEWNKLAVIPALKGQKGSVRELVPIAERLGFYWGGHFSRNDGMHFEIARVM